MTDSVIGALRVNLSIDSAEFKRGLTSAEKMLGRFDAALGSALKSGITAFAAGVTTGAAALVALTKSSMDTISAQVDLSRRVGASVAAIQTLEQAAKLSGASNEALTKTLDVLNQKLGEAAREGAGPAYEALQRLGLSAQELSQMDADQRIIAISDAMKALHYSTQQQADTLRDLGVKQKEIINLFQEGSGAINEARDDLKAWGVLLSDVDAAKVEAAGDAWDKIGTVLQGVGNQLAVKLSPFIQAAADYLTDAAKQAHGFGDAIDASISLAIRLYGGLLREIYDVRTSTDEMIGSFLDFFDTIAGAPPNLLAKVFGGTAEDYGFEPINKSFGKLRQNLALPPSDAQWNVWLANIRNKADEAAQAAVTASKPGGTGESDAQTEAAAKAQEKLQEQLAVRLETLRESLMSEAEVENLSYEQRLSSLEAFYEKGRISQEDYIDLLNRNYADHAEKLKKIDDDLARNQKRNADQQRRAIFDIADNISSVLDSVFGESKLVAIAHAIINTAQAVTKSLAEYGATPLGLAAAATAAAAGAAEIATISATTSKSGGGGGGRRSSSPAPAAAAAPAQSAQAAPSQTLFLRGLNAAEFYSGEAVRAIAEQLIAFQRDGGKVVLE